MTSSKKCVYTIIDGESLRRPLLRRIGTAFVNSDESMNVLLDALPVNGRLHIRDELPWKFPTEGPQRPHALEDGKNQ